MAFFLSHRHINHGFSVNLCVDFSGYSHVYFDETIYNSYGHGRNAHCYDVLRW